MNIQYVRLKKNKSESAISVGPQFLYPYTDVHEQDFSPVDMDDEQVVKDIQRHKSILQIVKKKPSIEVRKAGIKPDKKESKYKKVKK